MQDLEKLRFELKRPLLIIKAANGFLACGYINPEICNKTGEACAIVMGVDSHDDMLEASIVSVSEQAAALGVEVGESGETALQKMY